ncbi:MAG: Uncharacterised protein [Formosa sp. Hel1_33_131]|nr:MAG: Uncharacterised protein [Formosa sp. Hel1_33_131]
MKIEDSILLENFKYLSFTQKERDRIKREFKKNRSKKRDILLKASDVVYNQYYVCDGCLRTYFIDNSAKEHTLQFAIKD